MQAEDREYVTSFDDLLAVMVEPANCLMHLSLCGLQAWTLQGSGYA
jgi:hypothetical protein